MFSQPKQHNTRCLACERDLPQTAFYPALFKRGFFKCRDCIRETKNQWLESNGEGGRVGARMSRAQICPICNTLEARLPVHLRRWHGAASVSLVALEGECPEMQSLIALRSGADLDASWGREKRVYVMRAGESGRPLKIGFSADLRTRVSDIQVHCPDPIVIVLTVEADESFETTVHTALKPWHLHGEWFRSDPPGLVGVDSGAEGHLRPGARQGPDARRPHGLSRVQSARHAIGVEGSSREDRGCLVLPREPCPGFRATLVRVGCGHGPDSSFTWRSSWERASTEGVGLVHVRGSEAARPRAEGALGQGLVGAAQEPEARRSCPASSGRALPW